MDGATDFRRLFDIFHYQQIKYPRKAALTCYAEDEKIEYSTDECIRLINEVSAGLLNLGLKKGDKAAILSNGGHPVWNFLDFGMQQLGIIVIPLHATSSGEHLSYILRETEAKACFVNTPELLENLSKIKSDLIHLKHIFSFQKSKTQPSFQDLLAHPTDTQSAHFHTMKAAIHEDDLATIIYTSGTTGNPKGVMLSHKNIVSNIKATISLVPINHSKVTFSFLPLSHIFERMVTYTYMAVGAELHYAQNIDTLREDLQRIRPHYFTSVPRMLERMYAKFSGKGEERSKFQKRIIDWAIKIGERYQGKRSGNLWYWFQLRLADILVYRKWRKAIGGRVEGVVVGAAVLREKLARLFSAAGVDIREGYGMTETAPVISMNHFEPGMFQFGTVGIAVPGTEIRIDNPNNRGEGEIWVKGFNVMLGYFKKEEETAQVLSSDGWLKTGDVGRLVNKHFLQITDRKKDIFKTTAGKYVAPSSIENRLKDSPFINQCIIIGFKKPFVSTLIVPDFEVLKKWCEEKDVHWTAPQFMVINLKIEQKFRAEIEKLNAHLEPHQRIKEFLLLHEEWTIETGDLTATMKLKRDKVKKKYEGEIEKLYKID